MEEEVEVEQVAEVAQVQQIEELAEAESVEIKTAGIAPYANIRNLRKHFSAYSDTSLRHVEGHVVYVYRTREADYIAGDTFPLQHKLVEAGYAWNANLKSYVGKGNVKAQYVNPFEHWGAYAALAEGSGVEFWNVWGEAALMVNFYYDVKHREWMTHRDSITYAAISAANGNDPLSSSHSLHQQVKAAMAWIGAFVGKPAEKQAFRDVSY